MLLWFFFFEFVRFQGLAYICSLLKGLQQESRFLIGGNCAWLLDCSSWEVLITRFTIVQRSNWQPHVLSVVDLLILASLWSFDQLVRTLIPASSWSPTLQQEKCKWLFLGCLLSHSAWRKPVFTMYCWIKVTGYCSHAPTYRLFVCTLQFHLKPQVLDV